MMESELEEMETQRSRKRVRVGGWDVEVEPTTKYESRKKATRLNPPTSKTVRQHVSPPMREDDSEGHYVFKYGENLTPRFKILSKMGEGTFGRVLECWDREARETVAIKVVRSIRKYRTAAMVEIEVLQHLAKNEGGRFHCVQIRDWFGYRNHICIVFEKLGPSLFVFLRSNFYSPFPLDLVREFGRQLLESVAYMHGLQLIHTDLKPENILVVSSEIIKLPKRNSQNDSKVRCLPKSSAIKLIDFGSSVFEKQGLGWSYPCDLWSVGCILVELCTGKALFQTHENLEHLAMMERVLGPLPRHMIRNASRGAEKYFTRTRLNWPEGAVSRQSISAVRQLDHLKDLVSKHVGHSRSSLTDLLHGLLMFDPSERMTARQALDHSFFTNLT
ncbi:Serine/threonine-protein kinase AFC3 [Thalictrum thalictroides]|uniref:Serine/threonine-protein kinase AFC3 n=1 Tax=Thalictrum thalictroides TaxID=46969 RepID=A0A7J6XB53_THATH|nr:Serine/threonine-protein kinase AFC3 [Thalictrum thalictroides]